MASQTCIRYERRSEYPNKYEYWLIGYSTVKDSGLVQFTYRRNELINRDWVTLQFTKRHSDTTQTCVFFGDEWRDIRTLEKVPWRDKEVLTEWLGQYYLAKKLGRNL